MKKIIKLIDGVPTIVDDPWHLVREEGEEGGVPNATHVILPFSQWNALHNNSTAHHCSYAIAPWISASADFESTLESINDVPVIAVDFPTFRDGRGYSIAYLLRKRFKFCGELRAVGDILRDQLKHLRHCGFDAFDVRSDKDINDAILGLKDFSVRYQNSAIETLPLFRRR